jgi:hypothetical protein
VAVRSWPPKPKPILPLWEKILVICFILFFTAVVVDCALNYGEHNRPSNGDGPTFDTALLTGGGEVEVINLWDRITNDCQREGIQGRLPSGTLVGVTLVRNDCDPKMYFVGTGHEGEDGWVSELFLEPR